MENYEYLAELFLDNNTGLYNLFITTYNGNEVALDVFVCDRKHNMRMDIVSNDIYGTPKYVGTLCQLNNIINPFSIKENDILFFTPQDQADGLLQVPEILRNTGIEQLLSQVKSDLINALKNRKKDNSRRNYNRGNDQLPPTVLPNNVPQIVIDNDKIKITPNLFSNPNTASAEPTTVTSPLNINSNTTPQQESYERILVNRYIKKIS